MNESPSRQNIARRLLISSGWQWLPTWPGFQGSSRGFALVAMLGLLGLRIVEAAGSAARSPKLALYADLPFMHLF